MEPVGNNYYKSEVSVKRTKMSSVTANDKPQILHIVEAMGGGVFTFIVDLLNQLVDEFDLCVAHGMRPQTPADYQEYFDKRIRLIEVTNFTRSVNPWKDMKAIFEIKAIASSIKPDIIHLHSSKAGAIGRWAFYGKRPPLCYSPHGYSFLMQDCRFVERNIYEIIERASGTRNCTTIACSKGEYEESLRLSKRSMLINNGIDISGLQSMVGGCRAINNPNPTIVFTSGRICPQKNPEMFNEIAEKLPMVKFLWIGDGELRGKLTSSNIEVTGWVDRKTALEYYRAADVFVLTSLWEGMPISLLEAMYLKKTCLVSDVIGNRDLIRNGVNGFICRCAEEYATVIDRWSNGDLKTVAEMAYKDVLSKYNIKVMVNQYKKAYRSLIDN